MSWYVRSLIPGDVHRGVFDQGEVRAACGLTFSPIRVGDQNHAHCCRLPESGQVCPTCMVQAPHQAAIPATCSRHPEEVISLVVSDIGRGRITVEPLPTCGGCVFTVRTTLVFDALGGWLAGE